MNKIYRINFSHFCFLLVFYLFCTFFVLSYFLASIAFLIFNFFLFYIKYGGAKEDRTPDLLRARQALSQLSYGPLLVFGLFTSPC